MHMGPTRSRGGRAARIGDARKRMAIKTPTSQGLVAGERSGLRSSVLGGKPGGWMGGQGGITPSAHKWGGGGGLAPRPGGTWGSPGSGMNAQPAKPAVASGPGTALGSRMGRGLGLRKGIPAGGFGGSVSQVESRTRDTVRRNAMANDQAINRANRLAAKTPTAPAMPGMFGGGVKPKPAAPSPAKKPLGGPGVGPGAGGWRPGVPDMAAKLGNAYKAGMKKPSDGRIQKQKPFKPNLKPRIYT